MHLRSARFSSARTIAPQLGSGPLNSAQLNSAHLSSSQPSSAQPISAHPICAQLRSAQLNSAQIISAHISPSQLSAALYTCNTQRPTCTNALSVHSSYIVDHGVPRCGDAPQSYIIRVSLLDRRRASLIFTNLASGMNTRSCHTVNNKNDARNVCFWGWFPTITNISRCAHYDCIQCHKKRS